MVFYPEFTKVAQELFNQGGRAYYVGGCVRDSFLGVDSKDYDIEVHGLPFHEAVMLVHKFGKVFLAGASFGVVKFKLGDETLDLSFPRRDSKSGAGHKGFDVEVDPFMGINEALRRRDFTINAMAMCALTGELVDPFGGKDDLDARLLRAVDPVTFADDPLRVLRGVQFASRFGLQVVPETFELMKGLV